MHRTMITSVARSGWLANTPDAVCFPFPRHKVLPDFPSQLERQLVKVTKPWLIGLGIFWCCSSSACICHVVDETLKEAY